MSIHKKNFADIYASMVADSRTRLPEISDFEEGSVARSLFESFAYELAVLYEQLDLVYQAGFIDTAEGAHLDRVVAVLGIKRNEPDFATGMVTFQRDPGSNDEVVIPIGTLVTTEDDPQRTPSKQAYVTIEEGRLSPGAIAADVRVRAEERGRHMTTEAETIVVMPRPIPGVKAVTNQKPVRFGGRDRETDQALRDRAKQILLASGRASNTSIENALLSLPDVREVRIHEGFATTTAAPEGAGEELSPTARPGAIEVFVDGLNERNERLLRQRVDEVRAAGIYVILKPAAPINVEAIVLIEADKRIAASEKSVLEQHVRDAISAYLDGLRMGQTLLFSQLTSQILGVTGVTDVVELRLLVYREVGTFARGTVTLTRSTNLTQSLQIESPQTIRTSDGHEYLILQSATLNIQETKLEVAVQAVQSGRAGEVPISDALWENLVVGNTALAVRNPQPLLLARTPFDVQDKRITAEIFERFVPTMIRVAAEPKQLPIIVQIKLVDPGLEREDKRRKIEAAVQEYFAGLALGSAVQKTEIEKKVRIYHRKDFGVRLIALPFQSSTRQEDTAITVSFVEQPLPAQIFVYSDRVELAGSIQLTLPQTMTDASRRQVTVEIRRAIAAYLDDLVPEQDLDLAVIETLAQSHPQVLRMAWTPKQCRLYRVEGTTIAEILERNNGNTIKVASFEKVFLAPEPVVGSTRPSFVIQA